MESWCFRGKETLSPLVVVCDPSTLLHTTMLSVTSVAGLWPGSSWTGLWFCSLPWWMWPLCWPPCTAVCFWFLETYPGCAACSASSALLTNSSLSVWTKFSVCSRERQRKRNTSSLWWDSTTNLCAEKDSKWERQKGTITLSGWAGESKYRWKWALTEKEKRNKEKFIPLHHNVAVLHYCSRDSEKQKQQHTTNNSITPPPACFSEEPPLIANSPATVRWWRSGQHSWPTLC